MKKETNKMWAEIIRTCCDEDFWDNFTIPKAIAYFDKYFEIKEKEKIIHKKQRPKPMPL
jgi:hypothetical protein